MDPPGCTIEPLPASFYGRFVQAVLNWPCSGPDRGDSCSVWVHVLTVSILANCVCAAIIEGADLYMTWFRYDFLASLAWPQAMERWHNRVAFGACVVLYASWWPFLTIAPFFVNLNVQSNFDVFNASSMYISTIGYAVYVTCFSILVIRAIRINDAQLMHTKAQGKLRRIGMRALLHSAGGVFAMFWGSFAQQTLRPNLDSNQLLVEQNMLLLVVLHLTLNWQTWDERFFDWWLDVPQALRTLLVTQEAQLVYDADSLDRFTHFL